ncbi:MAG: phosphatidylserine decarboxylase family protein [Dissulfurispiraceae bacterium]|jgi:phosphatidylserine decarboxylase|nr:phosphatidylserine decarboxylase family protein [Dissulfurispiraceae bacterium]
MKIAPEGCPFVTVFGLASAGAFFISSLLGSVLILITAFMIFFFRDPERSIPEGEDIFISPADGKVIVSETIFDKTVADSSTHLISIFMSPLDVHVNRAPCSGRVLSVKHNPGRFFSAFKAEAFQQNENITMVLESSMGNISVRQVAGAIARRAVCRVKPGDMLSAGQRYGMIKFSSRVDIYLPADSEIRVKQGDRVTAGETILASRGR